MVRREVEYHSFVGLVQYVRSWQEEILSLPELLAKKSRLKSLLIEQGYFEIRHQEM